MIFRICHLMLCQTFLQLHNNKMEGKIIDVLILNAIANQQVASELCDLAYMSWSR